MHLGVMRPRVVLLLTVAALLASMSAPATAVTSSDQPDPVPPSQVVTVRVSSTSSTQGVVETWRWSAKRDRFVRVHGPVRAFVGSAGVGAASEYISRTPAGIHTLTETFGRLADPGARLPYRQVNRSSWWVSDVKSRHYNTYRECAVGQWCGFAQSRSENLGAIPVYTYAIVMDYNRAPVVPGAGSAFFLHETDGKPTQGCVAIERRPLRQILRWLKPEAAPVISVGVGRAAYAPLR
jgi:L,D-peptidoglycan transpeptidase YkuD (ErfK/YbiS/YcfS/YnhG family)